MLVTFIPARSIPGDLCRGILGERATQAACDAFFKRCGLDQPIPAQLLIYINNLLRGDLGDSLMLRRLRSKADMAGHVPTRETVTICVR